MVIMAASLLAGCQVGTTRHPLTVGDIAPDFTLAAFSGRTIHLGDYPQHVVLLNFWASWCGPCAQEAPELEKVWQAYREKGFVIIGVNIWDEESNARTFIVTHGLTYPTGRDEGERVALAYGVGALPTNFLIDRQGKIVIRYPGALSATQLMKYIDIALQETGGTSTGTSQKP